MKGLQIVTSLLLLGALCKADNVEEAVKEFEQIMNECANEQGLTKDQIDDMSHAICAGEELDKKFGCHMACYYKKSDVFKNGEVMVDEIKKSILPQVKDEKMKTEIEDKLDKCKDEIAGVSDECDQANAFSKCLFVDSEYCKKSA